MFTRHRSRHSNTKAIAAIAVMCLLDLSAVGGFSSSSSTLVVEARTDGIQRATIVMDSYSYAPKNLVLHAGNPVELTLENTTWLVPHNFIVDDPASDLHIQAEVGGGKSTTVQFTPTRSGTVTFYCYKKLLFFKNHREKGMEGQMDIR